MQKKRGTERGRDRQREREREIYIYIYLENRMDNFVCPSTSNGLFFVHLRILVFDCEGLFKSFDNTGFGHPPTVSKRGISARSGANWES